MISRRMTEESLEFSEWLVHGEAGPVALHASHPDSCGAATATNSSGEVNAQIGACRWAAKLPWLHRVQPVLLYNSRWATDFVSRASRGLRHPELKKQSDAAHAALALRREVQVQHVQGHAGYRWNQYVDARVKEGTTLRRSNARVLHPLPREFWDDLMSTPINVQSPKEFASLDMQNLSASLPERQQSDQEVPTKAG